MTSRQSGPVKAKALPPLLRQEDVPARQPDHRQPGWDTVKSSIQTSRESSSNPNFESCGDSTQCSVAFLWPEGRQQGPLKGQRSRAITAFHAPDLTIRPSKSKLNCERHPVSPLCKPRRGVLRAPRVSCAPRFTHHSPAPGPFAPLPAQKHPGASTAARAPQPGRREAQHVVSVSASDSLCACVGVSVFLRVSPSICVSVCLCGFAYLGL